MMDVFKSFSRNKYCSKCGKSLSYCRECGEEIHDCNDKYEITLPISFHKCKTNPVIDSLLKGSDRYCSKCGVKHSEPYYCTKCGGKIYPKHKCKDSESSFIQSYFEDDGHKCG